jgi:hypothetical protein
MGRPFILYSIIVHDGSVGESKKWGYGQQISRAKAQTQMAENQLVIWAYCGSGCEAFC